MARQGDLRCKDYIPPFRAEDPALGCCCCALRLVWLLRQQGYCIFQGRPVPLRKNGYWAWF